MSIIDVERFMPRLDLSLLFPSTSLRAESLRDLMGGIVGGVVGGGDESCYLHVL